MKIKSNEELFNEWQRLSLRLLHVRSIVQNDIESSPEEVREWMDGARELKEDLAALIQKTETYCMGGDNSKALIEIINSKKQKESAERWDALVASHRIRRVGSGGLGGPHQHLAIEFWEKYPGIEEDDRDDLYTYVDSLRKRLK